MAKIKPARRSQPKPAFKSFFTLRELRIASTTGHAAVIKANTPTELPRQLWSEAYKAGAMEFDPELIRAAARSIDKIAPPKLTFQEALERAVATAVAAAKPGELSKVTGAPKIAIVKDAMAALGVNPKGLTTDQIYDTFTALDSTLEAADEADDEEAELDTTDLEDEDGVLESVGKGVAGLIGEAEEADSD